MAPEADAEDARLAAAEALGHEIFATCMRAAAARYDRASGRLTIDLVNGCAYVFPARLVEDLNGATDDELAGVEVDGLGFNLHWPALDADLYVPALVSGIFGTRGWTRSLATIAGQSGSPNEGDSHSVSGEKRSRKVRT